MQVYMPTDPASRQALDRQMITWDENLEKLHIEQYQLRCYLAALQGADLPSTKVRHYSFVVSITRQMQPVSYCFWPSAFVMFACL